MEGKRIEVEIFGETIFLLSSEDDSYLRSLAEYVDKKMFEIFKFRKVQNEKPIISCMLLGLNIADELHKERKKNDDLLQLQNMQQINFTVDEDEKFLTDNEITNLINELKLVNARNDKLEVENKKLRQDLNKKAEELLAVQKEFNEYIETFGANDKGKQGELIE